MMRISVEKITNNENTFRTPLNQIDTMRKEPEVGKSLVLESSTFESGGILTSVILEVKVLENVFEVKTRNSTYVITVLSRQ